MQSKLKKAIQKAKKMDGKGGSIENSVKKSSMEVKPMPINNPVDGKIPESIKNGKIPNQTPFKTQLGKVLSNNNTVKPITTKINNKKSSSELANIIKSVQAKKTTLKSKPAIEDSGTKNDKNFVLNRDGYDYTKWD